MLHFLPFLTWLAAITSAVLLVGLWSLGDLRRFSGPALLIWFCFAGYCQFFGRSPVVSAVGLSFQTLLAVTLSVRWKLSR